MELAVAIHIFSVLIAVAILKCNLWGHTTSYLIEGEPWRYIIMAAADDKFHFDSLFFSQLMSVL